MNLKYILWAVLYSCCMALQAKKPLVREQVDWAQFMERQDMVWEVLPNYWYEAPFLGNGRLGLMVYQEPGKNCIRLETGDSEVHDHRPEKGLLGNPRLLTGHFVIYPKGQIKTGDMRLDLWNAELTACIETTEGRIRLRAFVHADRDIIVVEPETTGHESFCLKWVPADADSPRFQYSKLPQGSWMRTNMAHYVSNPQPVVSATKRGGASLQKLLDGGETAVCWEQRTKGDKHALYISLAHSYPQADAGQKADSIMRGAVKLGVSTLEREHRSWWHSFYPKSFLSLDDGVKENFYWVQLYKLASATRGDKSLIDNTGPWLTVTPWPNAWWNLNVQLTYWALNASNHLELAASLEHALYDHVDRLRANVPEPYRSDSYAIGRSSNLVCESEPVKVPGQDKDAEVGQLLWACHNLWLIYRFKMDDDLLRHKLFPLLKGAVNYYLHFLYKGKDGKWHLPATYSPEYGSAEDCNFDLALVSWGCRTLLATCERLGIEDSLKDRWDDVVKNMVDFPKNANGLLIGKDRPYAFSHRHYSHLLSIYPLYLINVDNGGRDLIEKSLAFWQGKPQSLLGYSFTGASSISSALGKGNKALNYLNGLFSKFLGCNTMYRESGPVIETPLSAAQSIHDMLLQSWGGKLRVFPAVPDAWKNITYHNWCGEGAFLISAQRRDGHTSHIRIRSEAGEPCVVVTDMERPVFVRNGKTLKANRLSDKTWQIPLSKGEEVIIYPAGSFEPFTINPVDNGVSNHFGKKLM